MMALLELTEGGLYCPAGDFAIDPWRGHDRAVITHAHADHLRPGSRAYLVSEAGERLVRARIGPDAKIETIPYGETITLGRVRVSLHPAGHVLGSAQIRVEHEGEVWVVSGDYKVGGGDPTCAPFEPVRCHTFITESTFGLPIYRWADSATLFGQINSWWQANAAAGKVSIILGYSLGKAQRILAGVDPSIGPIYTHGAVERLTRAYRESGVTLPPTQYAGVTDANGKRISRDWAGSLIVAPPSANGSPWIRKFTPASTAICSGWTTIRGTRRRQAVDRGFALSDHADWPGLQSAIKATGASRVIVTHGYTAVLARWLREQGLEADTIATRFEGEAGSATDDAAEDPG